MARKHKSAMGVVLFTMLAIATLADPGHLVVENSGKLLLISPEGKQTVLPVSMISAAVSPDGKNVAFTHDENPQALSIATIAGGNLRQIAQLPKGARFGSLGWLPDGSAVIFEGKERHIFLATISPNAGAPRDLGPWYQGFSVSPDGSRIVHAVNSPVTGLEVLDLSSGQRTLIHKTSKVVWDAKFSPDGQWIAYLMTFRDPPKTRDNEPSCAPPSIELRIYSMRTKVDSAVRVAAPKEWDSVKSFNWSPDSKRLVLTVGTTDCDYPGSANAVFVTTLDLKSQIRVSAGDMSFEAFFSPDGSAVAYVDFSDSPARLFRYDITTGVRSLIRRATDADNFYRLLDWR
jgi:Tol biopolymer transport system component